MLLWWQAIAALQAATEAAGLDFGGDVGVSVNLGANSYFKANTGDVIHPSLSIPPFP